MQHEHLTLDCVQVTSGVFMEFVTIQVSWMILNLIFSEWLMQMTGEHFELMLVV